MQDVDWRFRRTEKLVKVLESRVVSQYVSHINGSCLEDAWALSFDVLGEFESSFLTFEATADIVPAF